jgi:hypothetical protein
MGTKGAGKGKAKDDEDIITDKRFSAIHNDPRFARPRRKDVKVTVDERFEGVLKDKEFIDQRREHWEFFLI